MRISTIDIGTNTMLMLTADYDFHSSRIRVLSDIQRIPRLGKGVDANKNILPESVDKAIEILNEYKKIAKILDVQKIVPVATSFLRDANNKIEFIERVKDKTGLDIEILSGESEARWSFCGAVYEQILVARQAPRNENLDAPVAKEAPNVPEQTTHTYITIDIGGGSTEITGTDTLPKNITREILLSQNIFTNSFDIGSVRIKERFFDKHPLEKDKIIEAEDFIKKQIYFNPRVSGDLENQNRFVSQNAELIGIAGTITTLSVLIQELNTFEKDKIDGSLLLIHEIERTFDKLIKMDTNEILKLGDFMKGREDIITSGILILKTFMNKFGFDKIRVSTKGLRYGILLREE